MATIETLTEEQINGNKERILGLLREVERPGMDRVIAALEHSDYFVAPASTTASKHGAFSGGLAAHSLMCYDLLVERAEAHERRTGGDFVIPENSRRIVGLLHDYCKVDLYVDNELKDGSVSEKKPWKQDDTFPMGHGEKSVIQIQMAGLEMTRSEVAMIRWHMGSYDPAWRSCCDKVKEQFPEALVFHHVDNEASTVYGL